MPNLGNAWHLPDQPEPRGCGGMRDPAGAVVAGADLVIRNGNQFAGGGGTAANQFQDGSAVLGRRVGDADWTAFDLLFREVEGNNKYFDATIPGDFLREGDTLRYVLRITYGDRDVTYVHATPGGGSATTEDLAAAQATPFTVDVAAPADVGRWGPVIDLPNVAVHAALLPTGEVLMWGRRLEPGVGDLHVEGCRPFLLDPGTGAAQYSAEPEAGFNLFCAGHAFRADGTLLVAGGHLRGDGRGLATAFVYHPDGDRWERLPDMNRGRWYPTATCLPDGGVFVISGSDADGVVNADPQTWRDGRWDPEARNTDPALYPRAHVTAAGTVVLVGPKAGTEYLGPGGWTTTGERVGALRDYAPSVQYRDDRILFPGGGNDQADGRPAAACEILDVGATVQGWRPAASMSFPRRQHNATVLADGTVLVTGGTRGPGFNDLAAGEPVHAAELWDPGPDDGGRWRTLAAERVDRCYHAVALLLPDGRVLSAGGGEFLVDLGGGRSEPNEWHDTHADAQVFSPPYLFAGPRPVITDAPAEIDHGAAFTIQVDDGVAVARATLVRLGSVTHALAVDQRFCELDTDIAGTTLTATTPATARSAPPGPYLLFVLSPAGVPSEARVVRLRVPAPPPAAVEESPAREAPPGPPLPTPAPGTAVTVGLDGVCPYGIGACWGGASEALHALSGVASVDPVPDPTTSTATVRLGDDALPEVDRWPAEFHRLVNGSYHLRGFEVTLSGVLADGPRLLADTDGSTIALVPLTTKVQQRDGVPESPGDDERTALGRLVGLGVGTPVRVTGPFSRVDGRYMLQVRAVDPV